MHQATPAGVVPFRSMPGRPKAPSLSAIAMPDADHSHHHYLLRYQENALGTQKLVELFACDFDEVFTIAATDPCRRVIEIWEDGAWVCGIQPD